jgi:hypothetical protein
MFRLEMDASGGPVEVREIELTRDGTANDADITAVRLTLDRNNDGVFSRTDPEVAAAVTFQDGRALFTGAPLVTVRPGQRATLFVSVDVSPGATLYGTFGVRASRIDASADGVEFTNSRPTADIVITKTGGRGISSRTVINEVGREFGNIDWVEMYNPTADKLQNAFLRFYPDSRDPPAAYYDTGAFDVKKTDFYVFNISSIGLTWADATKIELRDANGIIDTFWNFSYASSDSKSAARYRDTDGYPMDSWYTDDAIDTKGSTNLQIPEFSEIAVPIAGLVAMFAIVRNYNIRRKRKRIDAA